jgi:hypothetical protein
MLSTPTRCLEIPLPRLGEPSAPAERALRAVRPPLATLDSVAPLAGRAAGAPDRSGAPDAPGATGMLELRCLYGAAAGVAGTATGSGLDLFVAGSLNAAFVYWAVALLALAGLLEQRERHPGLWRREAPWLAPAAGGALPPTAPVPAAAAPQPQPGALAA